MTNNITKVFCYKCDCETKQEILFDQSELKVIEIYSNAKNLNKDGKFYTIGSRRIRVFRCNGCESLNLGTSEIINPKNKDEFIHFRKPRRLPKGFFLI